MAEQIEKIPINLRVWPDEFTELENSAKEAGHTYGRNQRGHIQGYLLWLARNHRKRTQPAPVLDTMIALNAETEHTEAELRESLTEHGFDPEKLDTGLPRHAVQILTAPHGPNCYCHECAATADQSSDVETEAAE